MGNQDSLYAFIDSLSPQEMDMFWADGWRHFGNYFFRDKKGQIEGVESNILPLRINLEKHFFSKSQKQILSRNQSTQVVFGEVLVNEEKEKLFEKHILRFKENIPTSLYDFLGEKPSVIPCEMVECCLYQQDYLYAVSYLDIGGDSTSSVYAMFDPEFSKQSPGLHTLLEEINYSCKHNKKYLYLGYAYQESSYYDYKKKFNGLEVYDWAGNWKDFKRVV